MTAKIIAFIDYKGGVAKTTTTSHVGCSLAQHHNKRVLFVDIDPQTNLTFLCASIGEWEQFKQKTGTIASMYQQFQQKKPLDTKRFIWRQPVGSGLKRRIANLDLIPCDIDLLGEDLGGAAVAGSFPTIEMSRRQSLAFFASARFFKEPYTKSKMTTITFLSIVRRTSPYDPECSGDFELVHRDRNSGPSSDDRIEHPSTEGAEHRGDFTSALKRSRANIH